MTSELTRSAETKTRILDAAERLFAGEGFEEPSLRRVTSEAGVNLAAVNYHFGSKDALFTAVLQRLIGGVNAEQQRRLSALPLGPRSVELILEAFADPLAELLQDPTRRGTTSRLAARLILGEGDEARTSLDVVGDTDRRYLAALNAVLPDLPVAELELRFRAAVVVLTSTLIRSDARVDPDLVQLQRAQTTAFLAAALRAPAWAP